jgi:hypothetical protein
MRAEYERRSRMGVLGELQVTINLLEQNWDVYYPFVDDGGGVDLIAVKSGVLWTLQVKNQDYIHHGKTSKEFRYKSTPADFLVFPMTIDDALHIIYFPHFGKSYKNKNGGTVAISFSEPKNKQLIGINWWEDFLHLPEEI